MSKPLDYEVVNLHADRPGHDLHYGLDGKAMRDLGWKPRRTFDESMAATIQWQQAHPEWMV